MQVEGVNLEIKMSSQDEVVETVEKMIGMKLKTQ